VQIVQRWWILFCFICLFVCLFVPQPHKQFSSYLSAVIIIGDRAIDLHLCLAVLAFSHEGFLRATPTATRDLGLYGLMRKTDTHVAQWDSNPRCKDYLIYKVWKVVSAKQPEIELKIIYGTSNRDMHVVSLSYVLR
jgi:hypothetical protein